MIILGEVVGLFEDYLKGQIEALVLIDSGLDFT